MSRSSKKGTYMDEKLMKKISIMVASGKKTPIKTWARRSSITPEMVGLTLEVHNGKVHLPVYVSEAMVGHKLGEFSPTRTFRGHSSKKGTTDATEGAVKKEGAPSGK